MEESYLGTVHCLDKTDYNISEAGSVKIIFCQRSLWFWGLVLSNVRRYFLLPQDKHRHWASTQNVVHLLHLDKKIALFFGTKPTSQIFWTENELQTGHGNSSSFFTYMGNYIKQFCTVLLHKVKHKWKLNIHLSSCQLHI